MKLAKIFQVEIVLTKLRVAKLSLFWISNPKLWVAQVDTHFELCKIQNTKYFTVICLVSHICDLIMRPQDKDKYKILKRHLIKNFAELNTKQLRNLLMDIELGERKRSQLLRQIKNLATSFLCPSGSICKWSCWFARNGSNADKILEISEINPFQNLVEAISHSNSAPSISNNHCSTLKNTQDLTQALENL